jgi:hypothetical protein
VWRYLKQAEKKRWIEKTVTGTIKLSEQVVQDKEYVLIEKGCKKPETSMNDASLTTTICGLWAKALGKNSGSTSIMPKAYAARRKYGKDLCSDFIAFSSDSRVPLFPPCSE